MSTEKRGYIEVLNKKKHEEFSGGLTQISEATNDQLDQPLQKSELYAALQKLQGRHAPGIHSLTVEF